MTFLCFDFGTHSWGVAVGDQITETVTALEALKADKGAPDWKIIEGLISEWSVSAFVIGYPLKASGERFKLTDQVDVAIANLKKHFPNYEIHVADERLSTVHAKERLFEVSGFKGLSKGKVDSESAKIILENWFSDVAKL